MKLAEELYFRRQKTLPVFLSSEMAECGLVCLAMISAFHGHRVDTTGLRSRYAISSSGMNLKGLVRLADRMNFSVRALRVEMEAIGELQLPAIIHWDLHHFVVLKSVHRGRVVIHDPSKGRVTYSYSQFSKHFTGVALELSPSVKFEVIEAVAPISINSLWTKFRGWRQGALLIVLLSVSLQIASFVLPFQIQLTVDQAIGRNDSNFLAIVAVAFAAISVIRLSLSALRDWTLQIFNIQIVFQLTGNIVRHLLRLPSSYFQKRHVGDIVSRLGSARSIQTTLTQGLLSALLDGSMAVFSGILLLLYSKVLTIFVFGTLICVLLVNLLFYKKIRLLTAEQLNAFAQEQTILMETIRAATTIKLMGREAEREGIWRNLYVNASNSSVSASKSQLLSDFLKNIIISIQGVAILYIGGQTVMSGQNFSVGMLLAFIAFAQNFSDRSLSLVNKAFEFRMLGLHIERIADIIAHEPEVQAGTDVDIDMKGEVELSDIAFRYGATDRWIFRNLSLKINAGEFVTIVGPSGGGKSTLIKIMLGLAVPEQGSIFLDSKEAQQSLWRSWRQQIGIVSQDDRLMSGTLADNISFFDPNANMELIEEAATNAQIHADILKMPMAYNTLVGDMGSSLSGGQRQRILIARALYRRPKMLILDEGTAHLDPATEEAIADLVGNMTLTRVVVAHRPALVERAHKVFRIDDGDISRIK